MLGYEKITPEKTALIVVDVQNDFCHQDGSLAKQGISIEMVESMMPSLKELIDQARYNAVPIIFIQTIHETATDSETWINRLKNKSETKICRKNTWGSEFYQVAPSPTDIIVIKHRYSAFINTRLDSILRTLKIKNLLMTGVSTNICVESTARDGFMLDYNIVFLSDCTAAYTIEEHEATLKNIDLYFGTVTDSHQVIDSWYRYAGEVGKKVL